MQNNTNKNYVVSENMEIEELLIFLLVWNRELKFFLFCIWLINSFIYIWPVSWDWASLTYKFFENKIQHVIIYMLKRWIFLKEVLEIEKTTILILATLSVTYYHRKIMLCTKQSSSMASNNNHLLSLASSQGWWN